MKKRLFIGNLASDVREEELREKFGRFGHVENVEMHTKKDETGVPFRTFAYLDVGLTQDKLVNCIKTYHNTVWKGKSMVVQVAKESYIQKIRREAERFNQAGTKEDTESEIDHSARNGLSKLPYVKTEKVEDIKEEHPSSDEASPDEFAQQKSFLFGDLEDDEPYSFRAHSQSHSTPTSRFSHHKSWETSVITETAPQSQDLSGDRLSKDGTECEPPSKKRSFLTVMRKRQLDNEKRLQSLKAKAAQSKMQHRVLKSAFSSLDTGESQGNKKIVFRDSDDDDDNDRQGTNEVTRTPHSTRKHALFEDENEEDEEDAYGFSQAGDDFRVRPQFQGKKGQKVWELQSKIGTDERFRLTERFVESGDDDDGGDDKGACLEGDANIDDLDERTRNLKLLQDIVGASAVQREKQTQKKSVFKDANKLRFDPAEEDSSKFEVKKEVTSTRSKKKKRKEPVPPEPVPEVSKEQFYEISTSLRDALGTRKKEGGNQFSFSQMFHQEDSDDSGADPFLGRDSDDGAEQDDYHRKVEIRSKNELKQKIFEKSPFKHDSSDEEQPTQSAPYGDVEDENAQECDGRFMVKVDRPRFFFVPGDHRLLEGVMFFKRHDDSDTITRRWEAMVEKVYPAMMAKRKLARRAAERKYGKKGAWKVTQRK